MSGPEDTAAILERQGHVLERMSRLASSPPQSLVLEGGLAPEREALALHWAMLLNCTGPDAPCKSCKECRQIMDRAFSDLLLFGEEGSVKVEDVREARPVWGQPPNGDGCRVSIFMGAENLNVNSANSLLKSLEEPRPGNVFVLLAPQRERLLETLVSRSFVLTLAWPSPDVSDPEAEEWLSAMLRFWQSGQGWFERTSIKGGVDKDKALRVIIGCQRELRKAMINDDPAGLSLELSNRLGPLGLRRFDLALSLAQEALNLPTPVNPALVLDWMATRMR